MKIGETVLWYTDNTGWRTGDLVRVVERGRKFGPAEVRPSLGYPRKKVYVSMDTVREISKRERR